MRFLPYSQPLEIHVFSRSLGSSRLRHDECQGTISRYCRYFVKPVILKRFFCAKDLLRCFVPNFGVRGSSTCNLDQSSPRSLASAFNSEA